MTFPTLISVATGIENPLTSRPVAMPATVNAGDVVLVLFSTRGDAVITWDHATLGPWQALHDDLESVAGSCRLAAYWRVMDGTEDGLNIAVQTSAAVYSAWTVYRFSGASSVECGVANVAQGNTRNPDPPNLDPSWGTEDTLWLSAIAISQAGTAPTQSSGFTNDALAYYGGVLGLGSAHYSSAVASLDPGAWNLNGHISYGRRYTVSQTYALRPGSALPVTPPRVDVGVTIYAPTIVQAITPGRLNVGVTIFEPNVATDQELEPARLDLGVTIFEPQLITGIGPERVDVGVTIYSPTVIRALHDIDPARIDIGVRVFAPTVLGGDRVVPTFNRVAVGGAPGATGDLAIYSGFTEGAAFETRWATRGPIGFLDFVPFEAGEKEFSDAVVWLRLTVEPVARVFAITLAKVNIDVPDVTDAREIEIGAAWTFIEFARLFYQPPKVVANIVAAEDVTSVPRCTVRDDVTSEGFWVVAHYGDDTTDAVAARLHFIASGY